MRTCCIVDFEDSEHGVVARLLALGLSAKQILDHLTYLRPDEPLYTSKGVMTVGGGDLEKILQARTYTLAIVDGVTEAMTVEGLELVSNADVATWMRRVSKRIARTGAAVVVLDHLAKDKQSQGRFALGGQHKLAGLTDAAYKFTIKRYFARAQSEEVNGSVILTVEKDRPGYVRAWAKSEQKIIGELRLTSYPDGGVTASIEPPLKGLAINKEMVGKILGHLSIYDGSTMTRIEEGVGGKASSVRTCLRWMAGPEQEFIRVEKKGQSHLHWLTDLGRSMVLRDGDGDDDS